jgi:hypothetical protein
MQSSNDSLKLLGALETICSSLGSGEAVHAAEKILHVIESQGTALFMLQDCVCNVVIARPMRLLAAQRVRSLVSLQWRRNGLSLSVEAKSFFRDRLLYCLEMYRDDNLARLLTKKLVFFSCINIPQLDVCAFRFVMLEGQKS